MTRLLMALAPLMAAACFACARERDESMELLKPPLQPGQTLDPDSLYAKTWPGKPGLFKLTDNLILQIPPQFSAFWAQRHWLTGIDMMPRPPMPLEKIPRIESIGFVMHLPDFEGFTPDNYAKDFDTDRVEVIGIAPAPLAYMEPGAPGSYAPNSFARLIEYKRIESQDKYEDMYGLRCYSQPRSESRRICYGKRDSDVDEYLILHIQLPPYESHVVFPNMHTTYFSPRYGGLEISWRSHMKNLSRWREIDVQIWKYIDTWNIAPKSQIPSR